MSSTSFEHEEVTSVTLYLPPRRTAFSRPSLLLTTPSAIHIFDPTHLETSTRLLLSNATHAHLLHGFNRNRSFSPVVLFVQNSNHLQILDLKTRDVVGSTVEYDGICDVVVRRGGVERTRESQVWIWVILENEVRSYAVSSSARSSALSSASSIFRRGPSFLSQGPVFDCDDDYLLQGQQQVLAFCPRTTDSTPIGTVRVIRLRNHDVTSNAPSSSADEPWTKLDITAHTTSLAMVRLSRSGERLATASQKGTLIRIFETRRGSMLKEIRRGVRSAQIYSLDFSSGRSGTLDDEICVYSSRGTLHVFGLTDSNDQSSGTLSTPKNRTSSFSFLAAVPGLSVFGSEWSREECQVQPSGDPMPAVCRFGKNELEVITEGRNRTTLVVRLVSFRGEMVTVRFREGEEVEEEGDGDGVVVDEEEDERVLMEVSESLLKDREIAMATTEENRGRIEGMEEEEDGNRIVGSGSDVRTQILKASVDVRMVGLRDSTAVSISPSSTAFQPTPLPLIPQEDEDEDENRSVPLPEDSTIAIPTAPEVVIASVVETEHPHSPTLPPTRSPVAIPSRSRFAVPSEPPIPIPAPALTSSSISLTASLRASRTSNKIRMKYPTKVPVVVEPHPAYSSLPTLSKAKFLVEKSVRLGPFEESLRDKMSGGVVEGEIRVVVQGQRGGGGEEGRNERVTLGSLDELFVGRDGVLRLWYFVV